jgi:hypothetical protein
VRIAFAAATVSPSPRRLNKLGGYVTLVLRFFIVGAVTIGVGRPTAANAQTSKRIVYTKAAFGTRITVNKLAIPDTSEHYLFQSFRIDREQTDTPEFAVEEEHVWVQGEVRGSVQTLGGFSIYHMKDGEQMFVRWQADAAPKGARTDGEPAIESGVNTIVGGTGRYARVRGTGIYRAYAKGAVAEETLLSVTVQ